MKRSRVHQSRAIRAILKSLRRPGTDVRCQCIMACGTGKTFVGLRVYENLGADLAVIFVPTLQLVAQLKREWETDRRRRFLSLVVCGDRTVIQGEHFRAEDWGLAPTTDPATIASFMATPGRKLIFCTYQSSDRVMEAQILSDVPVDLIVCDEAHRTTGVQAHGYFQTPLEQTRIRAHRRLFMTATPRMFSDRAKAQADEAGISLVGMDDEAVYGPVAFEYSFPQAIEDKMLCDYRVAVVVVTDEDVQQAIQGHQFLAHQHRQMLVEDVAKHVGIAKAIKKYGLKRILAFVNRIETAAAYANGQSARGLLPTVATTGVVSPGMLWADYVEGDMSVAQRQLRLDVLANPRQDLVRVLYSARCLTEGIDTPAMDGIVFLDHRRSVVDVAQGGGRCLRLPPDWDGQGDPPLAYIVIPFFVPGDGDRETVRKSESFSRMVEILQAMKSHDERLEAWIDRVALDPSVASSGQEAPVDMGGLSDLSVRDIVSAVRLETQAGQDERRAPPLDEQEIVRWAQGWHEDWGRWPTKHWEPPKNWEGTPEQWRMATPYAGREEKWKYLNLCLSIGRRGLPGGSSLAKLLRHLKKRPETVSERQIRSWARAFFEEVGRWPNRHDGPTLKYSGYDVSWKGWDRALDRGLYGLPGGSSLSQLLRSLRRNLPRKKEQPELEASLRVLREGLRVLGISEKEVLRAAKSADGT